MSTNDITAPVTGSWWIYLIRTVQGHLYCGITTDVQNRLNVHASGKGAKYLRGKGPLVLEWSQCVGSRSLASHYEVRIKKFSKAKKEQLIVNPDLFSQLLEE